jgi:type II secretory pathway component PulJ
MSSAATTDGRRGFTLLEVLCSGVIMIGVLSFAISLTTTTVDLTKSTHARSRAHAEHRRSLLAIANVLRTASLASLGDFDAGGRSSRPSFQRILGVSLHERLHTDVQYLEWRPSPHLAGDVTQLGAVWLVDPGGDTLLADRIPEDGFVVRQEGNVLATRLTTFSRVDAEHTFTLTSETAVLLRN